MSDEAVAEEYLKNFREVSLKYLLSKGFLVSEIIEEYGSLNDSRVLNLALTVYSIELGDRVSVSDDSDSADVYAGKMVVDGPEPLTLRKVVDCAVRALGVKDLIEFVGGKTLTFGAKKALIRLVGKAAARLGLGYIGAAIAIADFVDCIY